MSLHRRLERLEARSTPETSPEEAERRRRIFGELMDLFEHRRKETAGEDPGQPPDTQRTVEDERRALNDVIPHYRQSAGWQTEEGRALLDHWEREARSRLIELENSVERSQT